MSIRLPKRLLRSSVVHYDWSSLDRSLLDTCSWWRIVSRGVRLSLCPGFSWARVSFLPSRWYGVVVGI